MAWDIHGNRLRSGYCEVHPDMPEEYPCRLCYQEQQYWDDKQRALDREVDEYEAAVRAECLVEYCTNNSTWYKILIIAEKAIARLGVLIARQKARIESECPF